jgi:hypothetical protein
LEVIIICLVFVSDEEAQYGKKRRLRIVVRWLRTYYVDMYYTTTM